MNALYERDPRLLWTPTMAHVFPGTAGDPAKLRKLTPLQFDALARDAEAWGKSG